MATYNDGTKEIIDGLVDGKLEIKDDTASKGITLTSDDMKQLVLPDKRELADDALWITAPDAPFNHQVDGKILVERANINPSMLYHIRNNKRPHLIRRDIILCAVLLRKEVPDANTTRHLLVKNRCPDLYLNTYKWEENCRNLVLITCLDYASATPACPVADWLYFTNAVIRCLNRRLQNGFGASMEPLVSNKVDDDIESRLPADFLNSLEEKLQSVDFCSLGHYRGALLDAYRHKMHYTSDNQAQQHLAIVTTYNDSGLRNVFKRDNPEAGSRSMLISTALAMGCNLDEINLLLRQSIHPVLYPNSSVADAEDAKLVKALSANTRLLSEEAFAIFKQ